jgi:predicted transposase/invertase (TIGR01784 family)
LHIWNSTLALDIPCQNHSINTPLTFALSVIRNLMARITFPFFNLLNDVAFKKVFGTMENADVTKSFLNVILRLRDREVIDEVTYPSTQLLPKSSEEKMSVLDIICMSKGGSKFIIEMQQRRDSDFIKRVQYYATHVYSSLPRNKEYKELSSVTLLSILDHSIEEYTSDSRCISIHKTLDVETQQHLLKDLTWAFVELPKFTKKEPQELKTEEDYWLHTLKYAHRMEKVPAGAPSEVEKAYDVLRRHKWSRNERSHYVLADLARRRNEGIVKYAKEEGRAEGEAKGRAEGKAELLKALLCADTISIDEIIKATGWSRKEIDELLLKEDLKGSGKEN